jgi:hypothetical protein
VNKRPPLRRIRTLLLMMLDVVLVIARMQLKKETRNRTSLEEELFLPSYNFFPLYESKIMNSSSVYK